MAQPAGAAQQVSLMPRAGAPARTATVWGVGFARRTPVRIRIGAVVERVRTGPRGRFAAAVRLPGRARPLIVSAAGVRRVVPRFLVRSVTLQASVTVGPRARRVALYPYVAPAGSVRAVRGFRWPRRVRVTARVRGKVVKSVRAGRRGRFAMQLPSPAAGGHARVVVRAGTRRLAVRLFGVAAASAPAPAAPAPAQPAPAPPDQTSPPAQQPAPQPTPTPTPTPPPAPAPPAAAPVDIAAAGDIACAPGAAVTATTCHQSQTSDLMVGAGLGAVLALGDIQYEAGERANFDASYGPTWGRLNDIVRPAVGNRDYGLGNADGYFDYFGSRAAGPGGYYSFDLGGWHLIALNSNCGFVSCAADSPQETWLRQDLAAHSGTPCQLAFWHHPLFLSGTTGRATNMTQIWQDLDAAGVDVVLNGHVHNYERFAPQNASGAADSGAPREFIVGTGGDSHGGPQTPVADNSEVRNSDTFGVLRMTLRATGYDWRFVPEAGRTFSDSGSQDCR
jgi:hypothetical protein